MSGKVGNVVYYTRNGEQLMRVYVKKPSDPKSQAQTNQRLKVVLAGRLSKIVPYEAIEGFVGPKSVRRSSFLRNVTLGASVAQQVASIAFGDIVFSEGSLPVVMGHSVSAGSGQTAAQRSVTIQTGYSAQDTVPTGYGERYVVLWLNQATSQFDYAVTGLMTLPESSGATVNTVVSCRVGDLTATYTAVVYVYPFLARAEGSTGSGRYSFIGVEDGTVVVDLVTGESLGRPEVFGGSVFVRSLEVAPPAQAKEETPEETPEETRKRGK